MNYFKFPLLKFTNLFLILGLIFSFSNILYSQSKDKETNPENLVSNADKWPTKVPGPKNFKLKEKVINEKKKTKRNNKNTSSIQIQGELKSGFSYETTNYKFTSPIQLDETVRASIGELFEGTYCAVKALPLPIPRADKIHLRDKLDTILVRTMEEYYRSGGPQRSAGVFRYSMSGKEILSDNVLVPFVSLGANAEGKILAGKKPSTHVLSHELAHQLTAGIFGGNTWANEGFAEYIGYTPYENKMFDFTGTFNAIKKAGMRYNGKWDLPFTLEEFFNMPQNQFYNIGHQAYTLAAMSLAYFFHLDEDNGIKSFVAYMKLISKKNSNISKAIKKLPGKYKTMKALQDNFVEAWKKQGITIKFKS